MMNKMMIHITNNNLEIFFALYLVVEFVVKGASSQMKTQYHQDRMKENCMRSHFRVFRTLSYKKII
jgi:hypothetical protein